MLDFYRDNARWLLGGFLLTFFSAFGQTFFIGIWGASIRAEFDLTVGGFGLVYMAATLFSALCFPFVGRLTDVTSVAFCSALVIVMLAFATALMSVVTSVPLLVFTIFLLRLFGQGMMGHTAITAMGRWYASNRGKAVAMTTIGHQFSEAIVPVAVVALAVLVGWRGTWLAACAVLIVVALPLVAALMRVERIPRTTAGQMSFVNEHGRQWMRVEVLRDPLFWAVCAGVMSPAFIGTSIWFHQDYLIALNGWSKLTWASSFALMAATTISGSLVTGYAIDRWSAIRVLPVFMIPLCVSCFILASFSAVPAIYITMFTMGLSYGVSSSLFGALWPEVYGVRHLGSVRAVVMAFMVFSSAAGPGVTGLLIDVGWPFPTQLYGIGLYCAVAAVLMLAVSQRLHARRLLECGGSIKAAKT